MYLNTSFLEIVLPDLSPSFPFKFFHSRTQVFSSELIFSAH